MTDQPTPDDLAQTMSLNESWKPKDRAVMSLKETGHILGIGQTTIFNLIRRGKLKVIRIGRRTLVPVCVIEEILQFGA